MFRTAAKQGPHVCSVNVITAVPREAAEPERQGVIYLFLTLGHPYVAIILLAHLFLSVFLKQWYRMWSEIKKQKQKNPSCVTNPEYRI